MAVRQGSKVFTCLVEVLKVTSNCWFGTYSMITLTRSLSLITYLALDSIYVKSCD